jgi:Tfp pilus assembly protein PilO
MSHSPPRFTLEKPRAKLFFYAGLNAGVALVFALSVYGVIRIAKDISSIRKEIANLSLTVSQTAQLRAASQEVDAIFQELRRILPGTEELLFVSTELEKLAKNSGLEFGFQYGEVNEGPPRAIFFTMSLDGPFDKIVEYLEAIRANSPYIMEFSSVDIRSTEGGTHSAIIAGKLFIR